ncbi:Calx-beta domain-containing protein [Gimesia panareensis]|uniref:Calx-beta domain-containing protein n=1 Tax=Gimesia panareensis TaxID=2527978 RepID=UPI001E3E7BD8|nr:Calx-beta domain-containing protein [Gimesia panareensis]
MNAYLSVGDSGNPLEANVVNLSGTSATGGFYVNNSIYKRIIDDGDSGFSESGWGYSNLSGGPYYQDDIYLLLPGANPGAIASWEFPNLAAGVYRVSGYWAIYPNRATNTTVTVSGIEGGPQSQTINQQYLTSNLTDAGKDWQDLGFFTVDENGMITVSMTNENADGYVIADAMRIERASLVSVTDITVNENDGIATITLTANQVIGTPFSIDYATADGTAVAGSDYTSTSGTLNFSGNSVGETQTITFSIFDDTYVEPNKTLLVNLSSGNQNVSLTQTQITATIVENDIANLSIEDVLVNEDAGSVTFTVTLDQAVQGGLSVDWSTVDGTAVASIDYTAASGTLSFIGNAGEIQTVTISLSDDLVVESDETFLVNLANLQAGGLNVTLSESQATGTITDDDSASLSIADVTVNENAGTATFTVALDQAVQGGLSIDWSTVDGTAVAGIDYTADSGTLNFSGNAGETQTITVTLSGDLVVETDETFLVNLANLQAGGLSVTLSESQATGTITDDDSATLSIADLTVNENAGTATFTVALDQAVQGGLSMDWSTVDGTAVAGIDYTADSGTLSFSGNAGETQTVTILLSDDLVVESGETFLVNLANLQAGGLNVTLSESQATGTITDDDSASLSIADVTVNENAGTATFTVALDQSVQGGLSVDWSTVDGTAVAGIDYTAASGTLNFSGNAGETQTLTITLSDDQVVEADETFLVDLTNLQAGGLSVTLSDTQAAGTITDDDSATLSIDDVNVNENAGTATFTVTLDQAVQGGLSVDWSTADGTAVAGIDYIADSGTLSFSGNAGETQTVTILLSDDLVVESGETFLVNLANLQAGGLNVTLSESQATGTITDDDSASLSIADVTVNENAGTATFTVALDQSVQGGLSVDWSTVDGTAVAGIDYTAASGTLNFSGNAGETQTLTITLSDDQVVEADETFLVDLTNLQAGGLSVTLSDTQAAGTITDDDSATLSIDDVNVNENAGTATFTVTLDQAVQGGLSVDWSTADGTAVAGIDYIADSGTLTFSGSAGETQTITITLSDDQVVEADETFLVDLTNLQAGGLNVTLSDTQSAGTITDDDSATLSIADMTVNENAGSATFTVTLDQAVQGGLSVDWTTADGTAVAGSDYVASSGTLNFIGSADETQAITVTLFDDNDIELTESLLVMLSNLNAVGSVTLGQSQSTAFIINDDSLVIDEDAPEQTVNLTSIVASGSGLQVVSVSANSDNSTLVPDPVVSYTPGDTTGSLSFTPNPDQSGSAVITITVTDELSVETTHNFTVIVNAVQDVPVAQDDSFAIDEDSTINASLFADHGNGNDADPDPTDTLAITEVNGMAGNVGTQFALASGALLVVNGDGTFNYDTNGAFDTLPAGETNTDTFTYKIDDSHGGTDTATVTITVTSSNATLSVSDVNIDESQGTATFTVTLDKPVSSAVSIDYSTADGTAVAGSDYTTLGGTLTFDGTAAESKTITVTIDDDSLVEINETFFLNLTNLQAAAGFVDLVDAQGLATVSSDDTAQINIGNDISAFENGIFEFDITLTQPAEETVTVLVNTYTGTADSDDFTPIADQLVTFAAGQTTATVSVTINSDEIVEADESFTVVLSDPRIDGISSPSIVALGDDTAIGTIENDDSATLSINDVTVSESGVATFIVTLDKAIDTGFTVDFATSDDTATASDAGIVGDNDYVSSSGTLTFSGMAGETQTITVTINSDDVVEYDDAFLVDLTNLQITDRNLTVSDSQGVGTITNTDSAYLLYSFDYEHSEGDSGDTVVSLIAYATNPFVSDLQITANTIDGTATVADGDYAPLVDQVFTVPAGDYSWGNQILFGSLTIYGDTKLELDETFEIEMSLDVAGLEITPYPGFNHSTATITITNDEDVSLSIDDVTIDEEAGAATFTVTLNGEAGVPVQVDYATNTNMASDPPDGFWEADASDITAASGTLEFAGYAGETKTITVSITADSIVEPDELFAVELSNVQASGLPVTISDAEGIGTILNNDSAIISVDDVEVNEGDGEVTFTVSVDHQVQGLFGFDFSTADDSAMVDAGDYSPQSGSVAVFNGIFFTNETITIPISDDSILEKDKEFFLSLENLHYYADLSGSHEFSTDSVSFASSQAKATIKNDDTAYLSIDDVAVDENQGAAIFTVSLENGGGDVEFSVDYSTSDDSATLAGDDYGTYDSSTGEYSATSGTLTFNGNTNETRTIIIPITPDDFLESDETFYVNLSNVVQSDSYPVILADTQGVGTILNDDHKMIIDNGDSGFSTTGTWNSQNNEGDYGDDSLLDPVGDGTAEATWTFLNLAPGSYRLSAHWTADPSLTTDAQYQISGVTNPTTVSLDQSSLVADFYDEDLDWMDLGDQVFEVDVNGTIQVKLSAQGSSAPVLADAIRLERVPTVSVDDVEVSEEEGVARFTVSLDGSVSGGFTVDYYTEDGTATFGGSDYSGRTGTLTFSGSAGETHVVTVPISNDSQVESAETFQLHLENIQNAESPVLIEKETGTATIENDDYASLSISDTSVNESLGSMTFFVQLDRDVDAEIQVNYATTDGTATTGDLDYISSSGVLTFEGYAGETQEITVDITDDIALEFDELLLVNLSNLVLNGMTNLDSSGNPLVTIADEAGTGTIVNDDVASITIDDVIINEKSSDGISPATAQFTVTLDRDVDAPFSIDFSTENGTAYAIEDNEGDFNESSGTLIFDGNAGETHTITVTINDDQILESDETFSVRLANLQAGDQPVVISDSLGKGTITDANTDNVTYSIEDVIVSEDPQGQPITQAKLTVKRIGKNAGDLSDAASIDYITMAGTATPGLDFAAVINPVTINFAGDATALLQTATITIQITTDDLVELDEDFIVELQNPSEGSISRSQGVVTILDNDYATLSINNILVTEGDTSGNLRFAVTLDTAVDTGFDVSYISVDGTASSQFGDYTLPEGDLHFLGWTGETQFIDVSVGDDSILESYENFFVRLTKLKNNDGRAVSISDGEGLATIVDNEDPDAARVTIAENSKKISVLEDEDSIATLELNLDQAVDGLVTVTYAILDGTATAADGDFTNQVNTVQFAGGATQTEIHIPITDDNTVEAIENFYVRLVSVYNSGNDAVAIGDEIGAVDIISNDLVYLSVNDVTVDEDVADGYAEFTVTLDQAVEQQVTVLADSIGDTAGYPDFQIFQDQLITFEPGETTQTIRVPIYNDSIVEGDETFQLSLNGATYGGAPAINAVAYAKRIGTGTIIDNDSGQVSIDNITVNEGDGQAVFTVSLDKYAGQDVTVLATRVDSGFTDAEADIDYDATDIDSGILVTIPAGQKTAQFAVDLIDDSLFEGTEYLAVQLSNPTIGGASDPALLSLNPDATTGMAKIIDNDSLGVSLDDSQAVVSETDSYARFVVNLDQAATDFIVVPYLLEGGSATLNEDFQANEYEDGGIIQQSPNYVVFSPGDSLKNIDVPILQDDVLENLETFTLTLGEAFILGTDTLDTIITPVIPENPIQGTGTITDDTSLSLSISDVSALEHGDFTFEITLSQALTRDITVSVSTQDDTATENSDYTPLVNQLVTIEAGQTVGTVTVEVNDDADVEDSETFYVNIADAQYADSTDTLSVTYADNSALGTIKNNDISADDSDTDGVEDDFYYLTVDNLEESVELDVRSNDTPDDSPILAVQSAGGGITEITNNGTKDVIKFTPAAGFTGTTTFDYETSSGVATVTIIVIDPNTIVGDFRSDRLEATLDIPELGAVLPDYESQLGAFDEYLNHPSVDAMSGNFGAANVSTGPDITTDFDRTFYDATGIGGEYNILVTITTEIHKTVTDEDQDQTNDKYVETNNLKYTYTETYKGAEVGGYRNTYQFKQEEIRNYTFTHTLDGGAAYTKTLEETVEDNYYFGGEFAEQETSEDGLSETTTVRVVNGGVTISGGNVVDIPYSDGGTYYGSQTLVSTKSKQYEDNGGTPQLVEEIDDFEVDFYENTLDVTKVYEDQYNDAEHSELLGTLQSISVFGDQGSGNPVNSPGDRDSWHQDSFVTNEYTNGSLTDTNEDFHYSGSGESNYSYTEQTIPTINGTVSQTITVTPTDDLFDSNGDPIAEYSSEVETKSNISSYSNDRSHDHYSYSYFGTRRVDDNYNSQFHYSDFGTSSGRSNSQTQITTTSNDHYSTQELGTNSFIVDESSNDGYNSMYKTIALASRTGDLRGTAHSEYTASGSSNYDVNSTTTVATTDTSVENIVSTFSSEDTINNYGDDSYTTSEVIDEYLADGIVKGTSTDQSDSAGSDYDYSASTVITQTTDTVDEGVTIVTESTVDSTDGGNTDWSSSSETQSSHTRYDFIDPVTELGIIYSSTNTDTDTDASTGSRSTSLSTLDEMFLISDIQDQTTTINSSDGYTENRNYDWASLKSSTAEYTRLQESMDSTGDNWQETFSGNQTNDYSYKEFNTNRDFYIDQSSLQKVRGTKDNIETTLDATDSYHEDGSAIWTVDNGGTSHYERVDVSVSDDAGENWSDPIAEDSTSSYSSYDWAYFVENGFSTFVKISNSDLLEVDNSEENIQRTIEATSNYTETSGSASPEAEGGVPYVNTTFATTVMTDDYVYANGRTENNLLSDSWEKKGSTYTLSERNAYELIDSTDPNTYYVESGEYIQGKQVDENGNLIPPDGDDYGATTGEKTSYDHQHQDLITYGTVNSEGDGGSLPAVSQSSASNSPVFEDGQGPAPDNETLVYNDGYAVTVPEDATEIGTVVASDTDAVKYRLIGGESIFSIDEDTGVITLKTEVDPDTSEVLYQHELDYETRTSYTFAVQAYDEDGNLATTTFNVTVTNVDEAPEFSEAGDEIEWSLPEDTPLGVIGSLPATDEDGETITYAIESGGNQFAVDSEGNISLIQLQDYETSTTTSFVVSATSGVDPDAKTAYMTVQVEITDVADTPVFNEGDSGTTWNLDEDTPAGTNLGALSVYDPQDDIQTYELTAGSEYFSIDATTGEITLDTTLDYETIQETAFTVKVTDALGNWAETTVTVEVGDVNENPYFEGDQDFFLLTLPEDTAVGTVVKTVAALDQQGNSITNYSLSGADSYFSIDSSGNITLDAALDYETTRALNFEVTATDGNGNFSTATFNVAVLDVLDTPVYYNDEEGYTWSVTDDTAIGTVVGDVDALGAQGDGVTFAILSQSSQTSYFAIDANTGEITVQNTLDSQTDPAVSLEVQATDGMGNTATTTIEVQVIAAAEPMMAMSFAFISFSALVVNQPPVFTDGDGNLLADEPTFHVTENSPFGTHVGYIYAEDPENNGEVSFSLTNSYGKFDIDTLLGEITVIGDLDHETVATYQLEVVATDSDGNSNYLNVTIIVDNQVEEGDPIAFDQSSYTFNFSDEDAAPNTYVGGFIHATGANPYTLSLQGVEASFFTIDQNGKLYTATSLDDNKATYTFTVRATETSSPYQSAYATVTVNVAQVNDDPYFNPDTYSWQGPENTAIGTVLIAGDDATSGDHIHTHDPDDTNLTYSFSSTVPSEVTSHFSINSQTGAITLIGELDYETQSSYSFQIKVSDPAGATDTATVTITVEDVEEPPVFVNPIVIDVNENVSGVVIADLSSSEYLFDQDHLVASYNEYGGNSNPNFSIDSSGNITIDNPLDYESYGVNHFEFFFVEARDAQGNVLEEIDVQINVNDVNERPEITSTITEITVDEGPFDNTEVLAQITAVDPDAGDTELLTYYLLGVGNNTYFTIDDDGNIRQKAELNYENPQQSTIRVNVQDPGELWSYNYYIDVIINDINEAPVANDLTIDTPPVPEDTDLGTPLGTVTATDPDSGDTLSFYVDDPNNNQFAINESTGEITLLEPLDYETEPVVTFDFRVEDSFGQSDIGTVTIYVANVDEGPALEDLTLEVSENEGTGTIIGYLEGTSQEEYDLTYALAPGETTTGFSIHPTTGAITLTEPLDYETQPTVSFEVIVTDTAGYTAQATVTINVLNVYASFSTPTIGTFGTSETTSVSTNRSTFSNSDSSQKISVTHYIPNINDYQIDDLISGVWGDVGSHAGQLTTDGGLAPDPVYGSLGQFTSTLTAGTSVISGATGRTFRHYGGNFRISNFNSVATETGTSFLKYGTVDRVTFKGEAGYDVTSIQDAEEIRDVVADSSFNTLEASQSVPVIDYDNDLDEGVQGGISENDLQYLSAGPSLTSASSVYLDHDEISSRQVLSTEITQFANGDFELYSLERNEEESHQNWELHEFNEEGSGNNGVNYSKDSEGFSGYGGFTAEEIFSNNTDSDSPGKLQTTTVLTENYVSNASDESLTTLKLGGANTGSLDWDLNVEMITRTSSNQDMIVDNVTTTDPDNVVSEVGTREMMRSSRDRQDSSIEVKGSIGGGGYGMDGEFEMALDNIDQKITTQHFITTDGVLTRRDYTDDTVQANNVSMSMTSGGDNFNFSFSFSGGNQFTQFKEGTLEKEHVTGEKRGGSSSSFTIDVFIDPNYGYHGHSRNRSTYSNEFDYTRYFDTQDVKLNGYHGETNTIGVQYDSRTGKTETSNSNSTADRADDHTITGEENGRITNTDANGDTQVTVDDHFDLNTTVDKDWDPPAPNPLPLSNPAGAAFFPNKFISEGILPGGLPSLFGSTLGYSSDRAPRTNLPPIATGTERDGTYWERYDNGTVWIYRVYEKEGGKLIHEEWGRHVVPMPDLMILYHELLAKRKQEQEEFDDQVYFDPVGLMGALNKKDNKPEKKADVEAQADYIKNAKERNFLAETITDLNDQINDPETSPVARKFYRQRLSHLIERFRNAGGDVASLKLEYIMQPANNGIGAFERVILGFIHDRLDKASAIADKTLDHNPGKKDLIGKPSPDDYFVVFSFAGEGFFDALWGDLEGFAGVGSDLLRGFIRRADPTPHNQYADSLIDQLNAYLPDTFLERRYRFQNKSMELASELFYELTLGSSDKADRIYEELLTVFQKDAQLTKEELDKLIELGSIALEEISNFPHWSDEQKSYVSGQLFYTVVTSLTGGGTAAKVAKAAKLDQLLINIFKSRKYKEAVEDIAISGRLAEFLADLRGTSPALDATEKLAGPLKSAKNLTKYNQIKDFLNKRGTRIVDDPAEVARYFAKEYPNADIDTIGAAVDEVAGIIYIDLSKSTADVLAHELHHVQFAKLLGKWKTGTRLTEFEEYVMELLAHHRNFLKGEAIGSRGLSDFLDEVTVPMDRYGSGFFEIITKMKRGDENYKSLKKVIDKYGLDDLKAALSFGDSTGTVGLDKVKLDIAIYHLNKLFPRG